MKLWLIYRTDDIDYDEYDSAVVIAETEEEARNLFPQDPYNKVDLKNVVAISIGKPDRKTEKKYAAKGIVCSSFNAG